MIDRMQIEKVNQYLASTKIKTPHFIFVSDRQYASVKNELSEHGLAFINASDFCSSDDKPPDRDALIGRLKSGAVDGKGEKLVVIGFGEYLALCGSREAKSILSRLKDMPIGESKVVLLLRGLAGQIAEMQKDPRFDSRLCSVIDNAECDLSLTLTDPSAGIPALTGFKSLLSKLENGACGNIVVNTAVNLDNALFTVHKISSAYEGIKFTSAGFNLPRSCGSDTQWTELLAELNQNVSLDEVFNKNGFSNNLEADFYARLAGSEYRNWLYFIALKCKASVLTNSYLRFVLDKTMNFDDFKTNILNAIIDVPHTDKQFRTFYTERKALVEKFPESDIAAFVINNRKNINESVYKLTDGMKSEREEIVAWVSQHGIIPEIANIYPALTAYMKKYVFKCPELSDLLTEYFYSYKRQKLSNTLEPEFLTQVDELAHSPRKFTLLPTRNIILEGLDKADTFLYWLDAFGVEYLSYIEELAQKRELSLLIHIVRAELPTITSINRDFFDSWQASKEKNVDLDEVKHKDNGGYNFQKNKLPIHLVKELDIIAAVIDRAATELASHHYKRFLIVSDHGASRLAVLRCKEEKYETDTKGEHSGRCCKMFQPYDLSFAAEENGYLVLADYGRFKGSRAANVEVHGGASLEEVIVPVIELTLKDHSITVELVDEVVMVDFRAGTAIKLFFNSLVKDVSVVLSGKRYPASQIDAYHYDVALPDTKRAGEYSADVYAGDDLIGAVQIKAQGRSGKVNNAFDDLF